MRLQIEGGAGRHAWSERVVTRARQSCTARANTTERKALAEYPTGEAGAEARVIKLYRAPGPCLSPKRGEQRTHRKVVDVFRERSAEGLEGCAEPRVEPLRRRRRAGEGEACRRWGRRGGGVRLMLVCGAQREARDPG